MVRRQTLEKVGGSVATILQKSMPDRLHLAAGDEVFVVETSDGLLITPFDPDFAQPPRSSRRARRMSHDSYHPTRASSTSPTP